MVVQAAALDSLILRSVNQKDGRCLTEDVVQTPLPETQAFAGTRVSVSVTFAFPVPSLCPDRSLAPRSCPVPGAERP